MAKNKSTLSSEEYRYGLRWISQEMSSGETPLKHFMGWVKMKGWTPFKKK